jgi:hypothetical protein
MLWLSEAVTLEYREFPNLGFAYVWLAYMSLQSSIAVEVSLERCLAAGNESSYFRSIPQVQIEDWHQQLTTFRHPFSNTPSFLTKICSCNVSFKLCSLLHEVLRYIL